MIASRSSAPVIAIAPTGFIPPTTPLNLTVGVGPPVVIVKALGVAPSLSTVELKTIVSPAAVAAVVKVVPAPKVMVSP